MRKMILTPEECCKLIPHWPELREDKLQRLSRSVTRIVKDMSGNDVTVMHCTGILVTEDNFILNGKHRALMAAKKRLNIEAYFVAGENDIRYNTPHNSYGEAGVDGVLDAFENKHTYIQYCKNQGIRRIEDFLLRET